MHDLGVDVGPLSVAGCAHRQDTVPRDPPLMSGADAQIMSDDTRIPCDACLAGYHDVCENRACPCATDARWRAVLGEHIEHAHPGARRLQPAA